MPTVPAHVNGVKSAFVTSRFLNPVSVLKNKTPVVEALTNYLSQIYNYNIHMSLQYYVFIRNIMSLSEILYLKVCQQRPKYQRWTELVTPKAETWMTAF